jgi:hypothetical protein
VVATTLWNAFCFVAFARSPARVVWQSAVSPCSRLARAGFFIAVGAVSGFDLFGEAPPLQITLVTPEGASELGAMVGSEADGGTDFGLGGTGTWMASYARDAAGDAGP